MHMKNLAIVVVMLGGTVAAAQIGGPETVAAAAQGSSGAGALACEAGAIAARAPQGTTIVTATRVAAAGKVPELCQVDAQVATTSNSVNVRLWLPATWNGEFYFHGVGGYAGSVEPARPLEGDINSSLPGLIRGYAVASTDTGHQGTATDASWALNNPDKRLDYAYRGTHAATLAAKSVTGTYYGSAPRLSYFAGCSNGGRQALMEAQRFPEDFDGIIAGDPATGTTSLNRTLGYQILLASTDSYIPASKLETISRAVVAACDRLDGLTDGLVSDPARCPFKPETLLCSGHDGPECLTRGQVASLKKLYAGFSSSDGKTKTSGYPVGHESGRTGWQQWIVGATPPERQADGSLSFTGNRPIGFLFQDHYVRYLAFEQQEPEYDWRRFSLDRESSKLKAMADILRPGADLGAFRARRGKLVMFHGWADPAISAYATLDYYKQVVGAVGRQSDADAFVRLFLAPGMNHCAGGPGPNAFVAEAIGALEAWVEKGNAPEAIVASHVNDAGAIDRTRPLCAWPQVARYKGAGSIDEAANFVCAKP
jgi:hypothetical protein